MLHPAEPAQAASAAGLFLVLSIMEALRTAHPPEFLARHVGLHLAHESLERGRHLWELPGRGRAFAPVPRFENLEDDRPQEIFHLEVPEPGLAYDPPDDRQHFLLYEWTS
jgi:hypothetical protein